MRLQSGGNRPLAHRARSRPRRGRGRRGRGGGRSRGRPRRRGRGRRRGRQGLGRMTAPTAKETDLQSVLASLGSVIVAYSGGVDSAYLALVANRTLGARARAVTADSPSYPERHRRIAIQIAEQFGLRHEIIHTSELERPEYRANGANRCYYCKHELYTHLTRIAAGRQAIVVDGNNA